MRAVIVGAFIVAVLTACSSSAERPQRPRTMDAGRDVIEVLSQTLHQRVLVPKPGEGEAVVLVPVNKSLAANAGGGMARPGTRVTVTANIRAASESVRVTCSAKPITATGSVDIQLRGIDGNVLLSTGELRPMKWERHTVRFTLPTVDAPVVAFVLKRERVKTCNGLMLEASGELAARNVSVSQYEPPLKQIAH